MGSKTLLRTDFEFAKTFLIDVKKENLHPYTIEKGYQVIAGNRQVYVKEIEYILSLKNPTQCLRDYVLSKQYLEVKESGSESVLSFKPLYQSKWSRLCVKIWYGGLCLLSASAGTIPILLYDRIQGPDTQFPIVFFTLLPFSLLYTVLTLFGFKKIQYGENLMKRIHDAF